MDDDTRELITQFCTQVGMIMEDTSVTALSVAGLSKEERCIALKELSTAATRIGALIEAAEALVS